MFSLRAESATPGIVWNTARHVRLTQVSRLSGKGNLRKCFKLSLPPDAGL